MQKRLISKLISKIKKSDYLVDNAMTGRQIWSVFWGRGLMFIRGSIRYFFVGRVGGLLFIGKHTKIICKKKVCLGAGSTIHDNCYINAMSRSGIIAGRAFTLGRNSIIECTGVLSELGEGMIIGDNVGISPNAFISIRGNVKIGDDTIIGPNVTIISENHNFFDLDSLIRMQGVSRKGIQIGNNCWLGANVTVLDGVKIGSGSIIAAGAVVNIDIPCNTIAGGVPARVLKTRT